jgi:23S rRNA pseudouridine1911/1915/1917 synthase
VHLSSIGHPLVGDPTYGKRAKSELTFHRQALHAQRLSLVHPVTQKTMTWHAPLPDDMRALVDRLKKS